LVIEKFDVQTHRAIHVSSTVEDSSVEARRAYHYGAGRSMMDLARLQEACTLLVCTCTLIVTCLSLPIERLPPPATTKFPALASHRSSLFMLILNVSMFANRTLLAK